MVALARLPEPNELQSPFMPIVRASGPLTISKGAAMCVVACTPFRLNAFAVSANIAARTTGAYSGLQPAITMLIASTSRVRLPCLGGTLHSTRCGSPPSAATNSSTRPRLGGTTGNPSVQPCAKYHSTRSVSIGTRLVLASRVLATLTLVGAMPFSRSALLHAPGDPHLAALAVTLLDRRPGDPKSDLLALGEAAIGISLPGIVERGQKDLLAMQRQSAHCRRQFGSRDVGYLPPPAIPPLSLTAAFVGC